MAEEKEKKRQKRDAIENTRAKERAAFDRSETAQTTAKQQPPSTAFFTSNIAARGPKDAVSEAFQNPGRALSLFQCSPFSETHGDGYTRDGQ